MEHSGTVLFLLSPSSGECFKGFTLICILKLLTVKCETRGYVFSWHKSAWLHADKLIYWLKMWPWMEEMEAGGCNFSEFPLKLHPPGAAGIEQHFP